MATNTRVATTIAARYMPTVGAVDAFYLDGRISGKREEQFADLTVDRADRGSFYAVYASSHGSKNPSDGGDGNRQILDQISSDLKKNHRHNIDYEINELAEGAVNVAGRLTLSDNGVSQPYFAGIIVKDGEMAAVTLGRGCAYLYRDDAIFPLTEDDYPLEPVDTAGRQISNLNDFAAGVAGAIRYSNIAQLRPDDCIIVCNCDLMEAIGQHALLQLLDDAEDQCDAAGLIMSEAVHRNGSVPMQIMIGLVEDLQPLDRVGRNTLAKGLNMRDTLGKGLSNTGPVSLSKGPRNTGALTPAERAQIAAAIATGGAAPVEAEPPARRHGRDDWKKMIAGNLPETDTAADEAAGPMAAPEPAPAVAGGAADKTVDVPTSEVTDASATVDTTTVTDEPAADSAAPVSPAAESQAAEDVLYEAEADAPAAAVAAEPAPESAASAALAPDLWSLGQDHEPTEAEVVAAVSAAVAPQSGESGFGDEPRGDADTLWSDDEDWQEDDLSYGPAGAFDGGRGGKRSAGDPADADLYDDSEPDYDDELDYDDEPPARRGGPGRGRTVAVLAMSVIAILLAVFIIVTLVRNRQNQAQQGTTTTPAIVQSTFPSTSAGAAPAGSTVGTVTATATVPTTTEAPEETTPEETAPPETTAPETTAAPTEAPSEATTTAPSGTYTVQSGDNLWDLVHRLYPDADPITKMNEIAAANGYNSYEDVILTPGEPINLP